MNGNGKPNYGRSQNNVKRSEEQYRMVVSFRIGSAVALGVALLELAIDKNSSSKGKPIPDGPFSIDS